jgi:hypothetical protein
LRGTISERQVLALVKALDSDAVPAALGETPA